MKRTNPLLLLLVTGLGSGCAIHHFDEETGVEHIWGFGHMKMRVTEPEEGVRAVIRGTETAGLGVGRADGGFYLTAGWEKRSRLAVLDENTAVRIEWPDGDPFHVRVGSEFPTEPLPGSPSPDPPLPEGVDKP